MTSDPWTEWRAKQTPMSSPSRDQSHWRKTAAVVCAEVMQGFTGTEQELRAALREAYPFGERKMWPYKCWLIEQDAAIRAWQRRQASP